MIVRCTIIVLLALLSVAGRQAAAENEPKVITLSCDGTITDTSPPTALPVDRQPRPIEKMGVVANLNDQTVSFMGYAAPIATVDAAAISFNGELLGPLAQIASKQNNNIRIDGMLDRVTGHIVADAMTYGKGKLFDPNSVTIRNHYDVLCKATDRVF